MSTNGKGDSPRPMNGERYRSNFDSIAWTRKAWLVFNNGALSIEPNECKPRKEYPMPIRLSVKTRKHHNL